MLQPTSYEPTSEDRLWLLRAVEGEGRPQRDVASALVDRFIYLRAKRGSYRRKSLADFVQDYSSPVNTRRMRGGDFWEAAYAKADPRGRARLEQLHERRADHRSRNVFSPETVTAVDAALVEGPRIANLTDFAAAAHPPSTGLVRLSAGNRYTNALYTADPSWKGYRVETRGRAQPARERTRSPLLLVAVLILVANEVMS